MRFAVHPNIYLLYLIKLSKWFMLIMPIVALFYTENGLDELDIYLLQAIYSLGIACMEIPSGYMADIVGRKKSLVAGSILGTFGFFLYTLSASFGGFLLAEIILGLGASFISGSDSALLYDSLAESSNQHLYLQYEGRITALGNLAETIAAIGGGLLAASISYRAVYIGQTLVAAIAIPASLLLVEPRREHHLAHPSFRQILSICHQSLFVNRKLSSAIALSSVIGTSTLCMAWTSQVYFVHQGLDEMIITPVWVILNLTVAAISASSRRVVDIFGNRLAIVLIIILIPGAYILLGITPLLAGLFTLLLFYSIRGYATPLLKDLTNLYCDSSIRATVLSIRSLLIRVGFAVLGPLIGVVSRRQSLSVSLIISGIILLVLAMGAGLYLNRQAPEIFTGPSSPPTN